MPKQTLPEPRTRRKVLFVINSLAAGGAEKILVRLVNHLDRRRFEPRLAFFEAKLDYLGEIAADVPRHCFEKRSRWDFPRIILELSRLIRRTQPDVIVGILDYANGVTSLAAALAGSKAKQLLSEHGYPFATIDSKVHRLFMPALLRWAYHRADRLIVVSRGLQHHFEQKLNLPAGRVAVIYNPIPLEEVRRASQAPVRHRFFKTGLQVIIGAGRLEKVKRFDRLLRAFARVHRENPRLRLILLGKGSQASSLKALARELQVEEHVDFPGFQSNPFAWIARASVFALTSEHEGFPNVLIEAMACGTPVVSVDCLTGPSEIITDGVNGFLVPEQDETRLASALQRVLNEPKLARKFSAAGRRLAEGFRIEKVMGDYEKYF